MTDAWSIFMSDFKVAATIESDDDGRFAKEQSKKLPGNNDTDDDESSASALGLLISRVDRIEEENKRSKDVIIDLQRRLVKAEQLIEPQDSNTHPWRRIGKTETSKAGGGDEDEEGNVVQGAQVVHDEQIRGKEDDLDFGIKEEYQITLDMYSVVSAWKRNSRPFWTALVIIFMQIFLLGSLLHNRIVESGESLVPANVPVIVHITQALATLIAIYNQDDLRSSFENYFVGLPTRFKGDDTFQHMTKAQWNFSCFIRFLQGFVAMITSFVLAIQAQTVFDCLINFLGVHFLSELDDLGFILARLGYFGKASELAAEKIVEAKFQKDGRKKIDIDDFNRSWFAKYAHVIGVCAILFILLVVFVYFVVSQNNGDFSPEVVNLMAGEGDVAFAALFRGCYEINKDAKFHRRFSYEQIGFGESGGKLAFCNNIPGDGNKAWVFVIGDLTNPCEQYSTRTEPSDAFSILEGGNLQWYSRDGEILGNVEVTRILGSSPDCAIDQVDRTKRTCEQLDVTGYADRDQQELPLKSFKKTYVDNTGYTVFTYPALTHPIFVESTSTPSNYELILYTGQSWILTDILKSKTTGDDVSMQEYMDTDPEFRSILQDIIILGNNVSLVTSSVNTAEVSYDPLGLRWFRKREAPVGASQNYPTVDQSRPKDEVIISCATCDDNNNPCYFGGRCLDDGTCDCINGGFGALCQHVPRGNGWCDPYFNSEIFGWDGGDCCGSTCVGPLCGIGGLPSPFGIDNYLQVADSNGTPNSTVGFQYCKDPSMAPLTIELKDFDLFIEDEQLYILVGEEDGDSFCSTATINMRCDGVTYLHFPRFTFHKPSDCTRTFTETVNVPFGSQCDLTATIACFGIFCLNHTVSVYYGNETVGSPIRSAYLGNETRLSFGVPSKCVTETLENYSSSMFDLSTDQGIAASFLSNDAITKYLCASENREFVLERYALTMLNNSVHLKSSNWDPYQCHGWGIPAVTTVCTNFSVTSLVLDIEATSQLGTIPTELALLRNLRELVLRRNSFTGVVPTSLVELRALETLELGENQLTGTIPSELALLERLKKLEISVNQLTGTVPTELATMPALQSLWILNNTLTGPIPSEFGAMPSLVQLTLGSNNFSGTLPTEFGLAQSLQLLSLYHIPNLSGTIPSELGNLKSIKIIQIIETGVRGTIPTELGLVSSLVSLEFWNNQLSGTIPSSFGSLSALTALSLSINKLSGTIPTELGLLSDNLWGIWFHENNLTGVIPTEFGQLSAKLNTLSLKNNSLGGELPSELLALQNLNTCDLANNQFSGGIAPDVCTI